MRYVHEEPAPAGHGKTHHVFYIGVEELRILKELVHTADRYIVRNKSTKPTYERLRQMRREMTKVIAEIDSHPHIIGDDRDVHPEDGLPDTDPRSK